MYKRRVKSTPRTGTTPSTVTTSTQKTNAGRENDIGVSNFPSSLGVSPLRIEPEKKRKAKEVEKEFISSGKKKKKTLTYNNYFEEVLVQAGFTFSHDNGPHSLSEDQAIFVRDVTRYLTRNPLFPKNVDDFFTGFEKHCSKNRKFLKLLTHTKTSAECTNARGAVQESLVRLLLSVDCLQSRITEFLLEKVAEFALTGDDDKDNEEETPWVRIILRQMRLLDRIVDGSVLNERLFAVLETAPQPVQMEIIFYLPDIIGDDQHHEAALQLSKLIKTNFELTAAIMEALDSLTLQPALRAEVCQHMLTALNRAPPEFLPAIITFLVSAEGQDQDLTEVVMGLRKELDFSAAGGVDGSNQVLILSALCSGALSSRKVVDIWLKAIGTHNPSDVVPLDIAVLLLIHHSLPGRKKQIQSIFRNRIKAGVITQALMETTFTVLLAAIKEYMKTALQIATVLFKSPEPSVSHMGKVWFKLLLTHLEGHLIQSVILELLLLIGTGGVAIVTAALGIMSDVEPRHLQPHVLLLMGLLDNIHDMDLVQVGQVMDLLCSLVYGEGTDSMHHDEIHMLIRKHLSSSNHVLKQKGVVGAVMAIKHMATSDGDSLNSSQNTSSSIDSSRLSPRAGRAKELLELVMESIENNVSCVGLLYDQLAVAVCNCNTLDTTFLKWITDKTVDKFQDFYVKELKEVAETGSPQFSLESPDEVDEDAICVDIEGVLKKEKSQERGKETGHPLCIMAPLFRLLRSLQFRISNNLESVDGLLGCAVGMPKNVDELIDNLPELPEDEQVLLLDSLFYCINWFRELINAFSLLPDQEMQTKVLLRMKNIISLQKLVARGLCYARRLDYKPPRCHFYIDVKNMIHEKPKKADKKPSKGKGKGKGKAKKTDANASTENVADDPAPTVSNELDRTLYKCYLRELDMEVFTALKRTLVVDEKDTKESEPVLEPEVLLFLMEDYAEKLDHRLSNETKRISLLPATQSAMSTASVGFANLDRIPVSLIARRAVKLLPFVMRKLETTAGYCQELLESNDGLYDGPDMFQEGSAEIKLCNGMLLHAVASTIGWSGFHSSTHTNLLRDCLQVIASRQSAEPTRITSIKLLVLTCCEYFAKYENRTVHLTSAENLVRVMQILSSFVPAQAEPKNMLADMCYSFLSRQWHTLHGSLESGAVYNRRVDSLVKTYLANVANQLEIVESMCDWVQEEVQGLKHKDSCLSTFPTINKLNFPILYRNLWHALCSALNKALESAVGYGTKFKIWTTTCNIMSVLTVIIKSQDHRANHQAYIKESQVVLRIFLSDGIPVLEALLKSKRDDVRGTLKVLQVTTRYLHALCVSTKTEKVQGLTTYVPLVRKILETLIFKVKGMLAANNCSDAFWMGNLKNKTIRGHEIQSQDTNATEEQNEDEGDEELPEDETSDAALDDDDDADKNDDEDEGKDSDSEMF